MSFGSDQSSSRSRTEQNRGLLAADKPAVSRGIRETGVPLLETLGEIATLPVTVPLVDETGFFPEQRRLFDEAVSSAASRFSGTAARRGQVRPENIGSIAGSAAREVGRQFLPLVGENVRFRALAPEEIRRQRASDVLQALNVLQAALGGSSTATSSGSSFGVNAGLWT